MKRRSHTYIAKGNGHPNAHYISNSDSNNTNVEVRMKEDTLKAHGPMINRSKGVKVSNQEKQRALYLSATVKDDNQRDEGVNRQMSNNEGTLHLQPEVCADVAMGRKTEHRGRSRRKCQKNMTDTDYLNDSAYEHIPTEHISYRNNDHSGLYVDPNSPLSHTADTNSNETCIREPTEINTDRDNLTNCTRARVIKKDTTKYSEKNQEQRDEGIEQPNNIASDANLRSTDDSNCLNEFQANVQETPNKVPKLLFLDLDNTLIPTTWIMQHWRQPYPPDCDVNKETQRRIGYIEESLSQSGLFDIMEELFMDAYASGNVDKICIVTNAGKRTVDSFYLTLCIPRLKTLLIKYRVSVNSTESWIDILGKPPNPIEEDPFREFYTRMKYCEFERIMQGFLTKALHQSHMHRTARKNKNRGDSCTETSYRRRALARITRDTGNKDVYVVYTSDEKTVLHKNGQNIRQASEKAHSDNDGEFNVHDHKNESSETMERWTEDEEGTKAHCLNSSSKGSQQIAVDIVSVGDQLCEIQAACRLAQTYNGFIRLAKVMIICDIDDNRFINQNPKGFVQQLRCLKYNLTKLLMNDCETIDSRGCAHWVPLCYDETFLSSIAMPQRFMTYEKAMNESSNDESDRSFKSKAISEQSTDDTDKPKNRGNERKLGNEKIATRNVCETENTRRKMCGANGTNQGNNGSIRQRSDNISSSQVNTQNRGVSRNRSKQRPERMDTDIIREVLSQHS